jgi:hypothetical protein
MMLVPSRKNGSYFHGIIFPQHWSRHLYSLALRASASVRTVQVYGGNNWIECKQSKLCRLHFDKLRVSLDQR